jgi:SAM-dependent methyltransferase
MQALSPWFSKNLGIDISSGMVDQYNQRAKAEGFSEERMHAVHGDLVDASASSSSEATSSLQDFQLVVMSMALHHVDDPANMIKLLADRLHPNGGILLIVDWVDSEESRCKPPNLSGEAEDHPAKHTTSRQGFKEEEVKGMFEDAGLGGWRWKWAKETSSMPKGFGEQRFFLAKGVKRGLRG